MSPEIAITYPCEGDTQVAILHPAPAGSTRAVVFVVAGGPQYRVGGHRQAVQWAREFARAGHHVLRFDYRGVGDSSGPFLGFEHIDRDIQTAIDELLRRVPEVREVTLWGECNAASSIAFYAFRDARVSRCVLLNPWVRTEAVQAQAIVRHYYLRRLREPSFWRKLLSLRFNPLKAGREALANLRLARGEGAGRAGHALAGPTGGGAVSDAAIDRALALPEAMHEGLRRFRGPVLVIMSGRDNIAREFDAVIDGSEAWRDLIADPRFLRHDIADADHTFSSATQKAEVSRIALQWLSQPAAA